MSEIVRSYRVPARSTRRAYLEVVVVERDTPRWRRRIALWLIKLAGRVARLGVRVVE